MFIPPCYNRETKTDCPDRKLGCHDTCEKWKKWELAKAARYAENKIKCEAYRENPRIKEYLRSRQRPKVKWGRGK